MDMTQKTICIIKCDKLRLPILDYIDSRSFTALALMKSVIVWDYKGLAMLIPPERIANKVREMECAEKLTTQRTKFSPPAFTANDTIHLPSQIGKALVGD